MHVMPNFRLQQTFDIKKIYFKKYQINFNKEKSKNYFFIKITFLKECNFSAKSMHVMSNFRLEQTFDIKKIYFKK